MSFVPPDFHVPTSLTTENFRLKPLSASHNIADYAAWHNSIAHIKSTPGFITRNWPVSDFSLDQNLEDLVRHEDDFAARIGFTYTVLSLDENAKDVIGCVYLYPPKREGYDVDIRSWVREDHKQLDKTLYDVVLRWISNEWPFSAPDYAPR